MSSSSPKYRRLSKYLSYILRHDPQEADLSIDKYGFADLNRVIEALNETKHYWAGKEDIEYLIENSDKTRFEIKGYKIRALYGHSIDVEIEEELQQPPPKKLFDLLLRLKTEESCWFQDAYDTSSPVRVSSEVLSCGTVKRAPCEVKSSPSVFLRRLSRPRFAIEIEADRSA